MYMNLKVFIVLILGAIIGLSISYHYQNKKGNQNTNIQIQLYPE